MTNEDIGCNTRPITIDLPGGNTVRIGAGTCSVGGPDSAQLQQTVLLGQTTADIARTLEQLRTQVQTLNEILAGLPRSRQLCMVVSNTWECPK